MSSQSTATSTGISAGCALAIAISYGLNHSIAWAIWHGVLGWIYVIYRWIVGY